MTGLLALLLLAPAVDPPRCLDVRLTVELVAAEPDIVTPTGLAIDERGRILVIENHTHQREARYQGPKFDRVRLFDDFGPDGKARKISTFADGFVNAMGLAVGRDGSVFLATRSEIFRLRDTQGKGTANEKVSLVKLVTTGNYPHNGLAGFAFDALGDLYFGLGENLGVDYELVGADRTTLKGGGEGGSVYRCKPDGTGLVRVATGVWNPFHLAFDRQGRLYTVDNDPDARGPCRLLHVVPEGDYGYRFRYGRKGTHPFQCWNGELPGTLPMTSGTAEAPSGIVCYQGEGLPEEYRGELLVTSWGDHVIERFTLSPHGASVKAKSRPLLRGDDNFRPVAAAVAPDGSLVLGDWVDKSYPVHGKGRIWRVRSKQAPAAKRWELASLAREDNKVLRGLLNHPRLEVRLEAGRALAGAKDGDVVLQDVLRNADEALARLHSLWAAAGLQKSAARQMVRRGLDDEAAEIRAEAAALVARLPGLFEPREKQELLSNRARTDKEAAVRFAALVGLDGTDQGKELLATLADPDPFLVHAAVVALGRPAHVELLKERAADRDVKIRLGVLLALRRAGTKEAAATVSTFLDDDAPEVRRAAIQWVGEEKLLQYENRLEKAAARSPVRREMLETLLAAQAVLTRKTSPDDAEVLVSAVVSDAKQPAAFRALALRMLRPDHPWFSAARLKELTTASDETLRREAVRTLAERSDDASQAVLRELAMNKELAYELRADAVGGLALSTQNVRSRELLLALLDEPRLRRHALRSLRQSLEPKEEDALLDRAVRWLTDGREVQELAEQTVLALRSPQWKEVRVAKLLGQVGTRPVDPRNWRGIALEGKGDPIEGERVFHHSRGPRCASCHRVEGRGRAIGPELSLVGQALGRDRLIESLLEPSKEIAPLFTTWVFHLADGRTRTGVVVAERHDSTLTLADLQGQLHTLRRLDVEEQFASPTSLMPDGLVEQMTRRELHDLLAYLQRQGKP